MVEKCLADEHITTQELHDKYYGRNKRPRHFDAANDEGIVSFEAMVLAQLSRIAGSVGQPVAERTAFYSDTEMKILNLLMDCKSRTEEELASVVREPQLRPSIDKLYHNWLIENPIGEHVSDKWDVWRITLEGINVYAAAMRKRRAQAEYDERVKYKCVIPDDLIPGVTGEAKKRKR